MQMSNVAKRVFVSIVRAGMIHSRTNAMQLSEPSSWMKHVFPEELITREANTDGLDPIP